MKDPTPLTEGPVKLRLKPPAERAVRRGHPWVFAEGIKESSRTGSAGDLAVIYGWDDRFLACGLLDPDSPVRVRLIHKGKPAKIDGTWWKERLMACLELRRALARWEKPLGERPTTGLRLINGDNEGFPGLIVDAYEETLVIKIYTAPWIKRFPEMVDWLREALPRGQYWPVMVRLSNHVRPVAEKYGLTEGWWPGSLEAGKSWPADVVVFRENGLRFEADVRQGQKTGFFLDQRENRERVEALAQERPGGRMLNVFSFSGAFSLYAARGGMSEAADLDISHHALESAQRNWALNPGVGRASACRHTTIQADAFEWLRSAAPRSFDIVVVDPPSLAKRESDAPAAALAYRQLARAAAGLIRRGGTLLMASCSGHIRHADYVQLIGESLQQSAPQARFLWEAGHASDHPATFDEMRYLKAVAYRWPS